MSRTSDSHAEKKKTYGIALLLVNDENKLFCVKELIAKESIGKRFGDYSFPWETQEKGEDDTQTLARLIREEIHREDTLQMSSPLLLGEVPVANALSRVYVARFVEGPENMSGLYAGSEIEPLGWCTKAFLLSHCREGVTGALDLLEKYTEKQAVEKLSF